MSRINYELPIIRPVSSTYPGVDVEERAATKPQPPSRSQTTPWPSEVSLSDGDITETRLPFGPISSEYDSQAPMLGDHDGRSSTTQAIMRAATLQPKSQKFFLGWLQALSAVVTSIFLIFYSYTVLVSKSQIPTPLELSPGQTVLVVNVLSHVVAFFCWNLFSDVSEALRWALACREKGVLFTTFLSLSRATPFAGVAYLCSRKGAHQIWCMLRLLSLALVIVMGLVLITDVTFKNVYTSLNTVRVIAGTAPFNSLFVSLVPPQLINLYTTAYTMGFLTDPRFVTAIPPVNCGSGDCSSVTSIFLPGGLELVRRDDGNRNSTLFSEELPGDAVVINGAPGYQVEFSSIDPNSKFGPVDCKMYMESLGDGLYVCIAASGPKVIVGWSMCPTPVKELNQCTKNTTWTAAMNQNTTVAMYKRYATTAYDSKNLSILSIESISAPQPATIAPSDFSLFFDIVFSPIAKSLNISNESNDFQIAATSYTFQYGVSWLLRLYQDEFQTYNDGGLRLLRGFLAVPLQFSTEVLQQMGYSDIPSDMKATATLSTTSYRAVIQPWAVWVFGISAVVLNIWSIGCLAWLYFKGPNSPNTSFYPEIDIVSKSCSCSTQPRDLLLDSQRIPHLPDDGLEDLGKLRRRSCLGNGTSPAVLNTICGKRIYCGAYQSSREGDKMIVLVTEQDRRIVLLKPHKEYS